jgi:monoterpene epsilon-lactone hydrolase
MVVQWTVDDRSPTWYTRAYERGMWLNRDKQAFEGEEHTLAAARKRQERGDAPPTRLTRLRRRVTSRLHEGMRSWVVAPRAATPTVRVFYFHGGGYVHPLTSDYWRLVRALTRAPAEVVVPAYPLAPDHTLAEVLPRLVRLVEALADDGLPTVLMGDSAGGALVLAVARQLAERGGTAPSANILLSPWLDATLDEDEVAALEASDPMLAESGLRAAGRWWAGGRDPSDPLVSPVNAGLTGLAPTHLFIGRHDILRPAVDEFAANARRDGLELHVHEVVAMFHVWMTRAIPEGARTRRQLRALVGGIAG